MVQVYLTHHDENKNIHRFYQLFITPTLFEEWTLVRERGRVGSPGTVRKDWFDTKKDAIKAGEKIVFAKHKKGYKTLYQH